MVRCLVAMAALEASVRPRRSGASRPRSWGPCMQGLCTPVERCAPNHSAITQHGRAFQRVALHFLHMHPPVRVFAPFYDRH